MLRAVKKAIRFFSLGLLAAGWLLSPLSVAAQVVIPPGPNPVLTKTMSPARPRIGEAARITITATNTGSANADNVVITDPLPDNIALLVVAASQGNIRVDHHIVTVYVGTLSPGQTVTVTNDVVILREFAADTPYTNCTGLTYRDGTARLACFPFGPAYTPVSVTTPPSFLPEAGSGVSPLAVVLLIAGLTCLWQARRLRRSSPA